MAGIILNLVSLKVKADAAGVGTTATSTTPSLCPLKSAIAGYVTNGASVVNISGTWANNELVEDACVAVSKTVTETTTLYRNVTTSNQRGGADIPAGGGSSRVYKVVTYEYATQTNYSDGTSTTSAYTSGSYTVLGSRISANSLGTTAKVRTKIGTSSATETVAGLSVSVSGDIYLAKNEVTSTETIYSDHSLGTSTASDIPASGGSVSAYAIVTYKYCTRSWYTSGSYSDGTKYNSSGYIYGSDVTANSLEKTLKLRTSTGKTSTPTGTVGEQSFTGTAVTIYLEANYINKIEATTSENVSTHVIYSNMSADGGTVTPSGTGRCKYTFKSGSTETTDSTSPFTGVTATYTRSYSLSNNPNGVFSINSSTGAVTAGANTSTTNTRIATIAAVLTVSISYSSTFSSLTKPSNSTIIHYPTCTLNKASGPSISSQSFYFTGTSPLPDVSCDGGKNDVPTITLCMWITTYSDGTTETTNIDVNNVTWTYAKYTKNSTYYDSSHYPGYDIPTYYTGSSNAQFDLGVNTGDRYLKGWVFIKGTYGGKTDYIRREVWQAQGSESYAINATYNVNNIPYYGGTCERPYLTSIVLYHIVNGTPASSTSLSESNISIVGYANNNTGTAPDADSSYTSEGYKYTMSLNAYTSEQTGNWIFMRFKYTPSGWTLLTYTYKKQVKQNGNPGSGFILIVNNPVPPANVQNPTVVFCDESKSLRYLVDSWYSPQTKMNARWQNSGAVLKIYIVMNSDASSLYTDYKYLKITGVTESGAPLAILNKTNIRNYFTSNTDNESDLISLTNSFNTSDFDSGGPAQIILTFTTS